jgi:hypothetical protein
MHALLCLAMLTVGEKPAVDLLDLNFLELSYRLRLERELARLDRDDPGWRFDDLQAARAVVPDDRNLALKVMQLRERMPKDWPSWERVVVPGKPDADSTTRRFFADDLLQQIEGRPEVCLGREAAQVLKAALSEAKIEGSDIRSLAKFVTGRYPLVKAQDAFVQVEGLSDARRLSTLLHYEIMLAAEERDATRAMNSLASMFAIVRSFGDDGHESSIVNRTAIAILACECVERLVAQFELGDPQLVSLQDMLGSLARENLFPRFVRTSRAEAELCLRWFEEGGWEKTQKESKAFFGRLTWEVHRPSPEAFWNSRWRNLSYSSEVIDWDAGGRKGEMPPIEIAPFSFGVLLDTHESLRRVRDLVSAIRMAEAHLRSAVTAVAVERYRQTEGKWPAKLTDLTPRYMEAVPMDPFAARPLKYVATENGMVIYSVGEDGKDQKGKRRTAEQSFSSDRSWDRGVRLWNTDARRQPPLPPLKREDE